MSDVLRGRIARALWDHEFPDEPWHDDYSDHEYAKADAVIAALGLRQEWDGEGAFWRTPWERIEEDQ